MKYVTAYAVAVCVMLTVNRVRADTIVTTFFEEFHATVSSVPVNIGGMQFETGPITLSLDPTNPSNDFATFDFDTLLMQIGVDLLVTAPLFDSFDIGSIPVRSMQTGTFVPSSSVPFAVVSSAAIGPVIVPPGNPFSDLSITVEESGTWRHFSDNCFFWCHDFGGSIMFVGPNGATSVSTLNGTAFLGMQPVPEPYTINLLAIGVFLLLAAPEALLRLKFARMFFSRALSPLCFGEQQIPGEPL